MRISNLQLKQSNIHNMMRNNQGVVKTQRQLITGKQFSRPSDAPLKTITSLYSRIRLNQLERYTENIAEVNTRLRIAHDQLSSANDVVRRVRELTLQAANGPLTRSDRHNIALEVEEMLKQLVTLANSQHEAKYLFAGSKDIVAPFKTTTAFQTELGRPLINHVSYEGDYRPHIVQIGDNDNARILANGSEIFWADQETLIPRRDSRNFINPETATIRIDGFTVQLNAGDNLAIIAETINTKIPTVTAFSQELPSGELALAIESNYPHKIALEDLKGGTLLRQLGFLKADAPGNVPYDNLSANVLATDGSIFDRVIRLRDALLDNQLRELGGLHLGGITRGLDNLVKGQAKLSALTTRTQLTKQALANERQTVIERRSANEDADIATAATAFNEWNYLHRITLQTASRLLETTLLDFL